VARNGSDEITFGRPLFQKEKVKTYANMRKNGLSTPVIFRCRARNTVTNTLRFFLSNPILDLVNRNPVRVVNTLV